ncbi:MAG TPA: hypothetical protein VMN57_17240 [Anaerolineales bacterium]|nr:hypothetical protein [Anaerolineales bacterium]
MADRTGVSGAAAGALSAAVFALIHDLFISDIWFSLIPMMIAGAVCGGCIGWTYGLLFERLSVRSWLGYNGLFVVMFGLLGLVSVLVFEPVTTIAALITDGGPPTTLIDQALPMTIVFTLAMAGIFSLLFARTWRQAGSVLLTCVVLVALLGLNVSVIGLVSIPRTSFYLVGEMFGLILVLDVVYLLVFIAWERRSFTSGSGSGGR